jgi:hypothetical protein
MGVDVTFYVIDESSTKERTYAARVIELEKDYDLWIQFDRLPVQGHTGETRLFRKGREDAIEEDGLVDFPLFPGEYNPAAGFKVYNVADLKNLSPRGGNEKIFKFLIESYPTSKFLILYG